jgi:glycosyltransferase involved in cell wall biosynthesis
MRIALYAPFKPLDHPNPSGDLIIAKGIKDFLEKHHHNITIPSRHRTRWIYWKPFRFLMTLSEIRKAKKRLMPFAPDLWLTYHTYYKSPDLLGPHLCRKLNLPYVIFQGIYSTKRKRSMKTWPGFMFNKHALLSARHIFTNRMQDFKNLKRIIPETQLSYIAPGIYPDQFRYDEKAGKTLRQKWSVGEKPVLLSAAMFRPDVKTRGLLWLLETLSQHIEMDFALVIAGDGSQRSLLEKQAALMLPGRVRFVGKIPREEMNSFYSAGDLFVFPGIRESLGMVYLEAQSCGIPVIAFNNGGIPEVVKHAKTGLLSSPYDRVAFAKNIKTILMDGALRATFSTNAAASIRRDHNLDINYQKMERILLSICQGSQK